MIAGEGLDAVEDEFADDWAGAESTTNNCMDDADDKPAQSAKLSRYVPPSSVGFSAASYKKRL